MEANRSAVRRGRVGLAASASFAGAQTTSTAEDEAAIRSVMAKGAEAFNQHDAAAAAAVYAADADLVNVRGDHLKGSVAIERGLERAFATRYREARIKRGDVTIRFIRPDVALAYVTNEISGAGEAGSGGAPVQREIGLRVFVKDGGVWRIAALHNTPVGAR